MRVVITGSKGFIGSRLIPVLQKNDYEIIELDSIDGYDITDWKQIKNIKDIDFVIHLAAISYVPKSYKIPREMYRVNIIGTLNVLELCRINNSKMIFTSSYVYGKPKYLPIDEKHPTFAFNPYCQSKLIGEQLCEGYNRDFSVPVIIFRSFNIYGPGQNPNFLIPSIKKQIEDNGKVKLENPRPKRDFIHIDDIVNAYCKAIEYGRSDFEIFNFGSGKSYSVKEIAELLISLSGEKIPLEFSKQQRENEVLDTVADIKKIKDRLNWQPTISIEEGLSKLLSN